MKIFLLLFCSAALFSCIDLGIKNKTKQNESTQDITQKHDSTYYADSIYYANLELDSLVYNLKGEYKLYLYPTDGNKQYSLRIKGNGTDRVFTDFPTCTKKYIPVFKGVDFDDYFVIQALGTYFIYEKKTGEELLNVYKIGNFDARRNLLIYLSGEEGLVLMNFKSLKKVCIDDYIKDTEASPYMGSAGAYLHYFIHKITDKYIIIRFTLGQKEENEEPIDIKIPIDKIM